MKKPPVFILGNRRSGTTMLRLMLTSHRDICIPPEGGFVVRLAWRHGRRAVMDDSALRRFVCDLFRLNHIRDWGIDRSSLQARLVAMAPCSYSAAVAGVYEEYMERRCPGKTRWGDKTPWYVQYAGDVSRLFPDAQFIHLVRDGRAVLASYRRVSHLPGEVASVAAEWISSVHAAMRVGATSGTTRYLELRYEDLVDAPEQRLRDVCRFLDHPFDEDMLDFWRRNRDEGLVPDRHRDWKQLTFRQITSSRRAGWRDELSAGDISRFEAVAGGLLERLGYERHGGPLPPHEARALRAVAALHLFINAVKRGLRPWKNRFRVTPGRKLL